MNILGTMSFKQNKKMSDFRLDSRDNHANYLPFNSETLREYYNFQTINNVFVEKFYSKKVDFISPSKSTSADYDMNICPSNYTNMNYDISYIKKQY